MIVIQFSDSADQENVEFSTFNNQNNSSEPDVNKQIELAKLRVQVLQLKLQIKRLAVSLNFNLNSSQTLTLSV